MWKNTFHDRNQLETKNLPKNNNSSFFTFRLDKKNYWVCSSRIQVWQIPYFSPACTYSFPNFQRRGGKREKGRGGKGRGSKTGFFLPFLSCSPSRYPARRENLSPLVLSRILGPFFRIFLKMPHFFLGNRGKGGEFAKCGRNFRQKSALYPKPPPPTQPP